MEPTDPFVHLPVSLARSILSNWLGAKSLSKLDVAYCNHKQRNTFLEILNDSEQPGADNDVYTHNQTDISRLRWMNMRNVKCSSVRIMMFRAMSPTNLSVVFSFLHGVAGCLKTAHVCAPSSLLGILLHAIAAAKCAFVTFSLVIQREDGDAAQWGESLQQILANSSAVLTNLFVTGSIDWQKALVGVSLPALRDPWVTVSSDSDLIGLCTAAPNINKLSVEITACTSTGFAALAQHCRVLETLSVCCRPNRNSHSGIVDLNVGMAVMSQGCVTLKHMHFKCCAALTNVGLRAIAAHCTQLQSLSLTQCNSCTDEGLGALQYLSATFLSLHLNECPGITGSGIVAIATHCKLLHTLVIKDYESGLEANQLAEALPHMHSMTKLVLRYNATDAEMLQQIAQHMPLLQHLDLGAENYDFDAIDYTSEDLVGLVTKCEKLTYLELPKRVLNDGTRELLLQLRPGVVISGYTQLSV